MKQIVENAFFALLRFEINGIELSDSEKNSITPDSLPALFMLSKNHDLAHLIGDALDKNQLLIENSKARQYFFQERNLAIYRYEQQQYELDRLKNVFESEEIPFIALKGSVIKNYYKEPWMRTSCDIDILVQEQDLDRAISLLQQTLKYKTEEKKEYHDISLYSESGVHIELHYSLCENMPNVDLLLSRVWDYAEQKEGKIERILNQEYFVFHIVAHMLYHFQKGGCGVRPLLDLYLLQKNFLFGTKLDDMISQCGIATFYQTMLKLSKCWLENIECDEKVLCVQDYLLKAGVYGTKSNSELADTVKSGSKKKRILKYPFFHILE